MNQSEIQILLNKNKSKYIIDFLENCKRDLKHYRKLYGRWNTITSAVKYTSYSILGVTETAGIIIALFTTAGIIIPIIIGGSGLV